jgi:hypothetical protein
LLEALDFLRTWVELQKHAPNQERSNSGQEIESLKAELQSLEADAVEELRTLRGESPSPAINVAGPLCETSVSRIGDLFDPTIPIPASEPRVSTLLDVDLLHVSRLRLSETWELEWESMESALTALEEFAAGPKPSWQTTFANRSDQRDHRSTFRILEYLEQEPQPGFSSDAIQQLQGIRQRNPTLTAARYCC